VFLRKKNYLEHIEFGIESLKRAYSSER